MGRAGACLGMPLIRDESQPEITKAIEASWTPDQRAQVLTAASDQPSEALFHGLRGVLPNLRILSLDPVHLAITYETAHFRKKTDGSRDLRRLLAKFNKFPHAAGGMAWGVAYAGTGTVPQSEHERKLREKILDHKMPLATAKRVLAEIDPNLPWASSIDFVRALAALSAVYPDETKRKSHIAGQPLRKLLWNAAHPSRIQWYANNLRALRDMGTWGAALVASGTSANEALNHEINSWFRNQPDVYASTVDLQLRVSALGKLLAHNSALYSPTTSAMTPSLVLARAVAALAQTEGDWKTYTAELANTARGTTRSSVLPLHQLRRRHSGMIAAHKAKTTTAVLKRPSRGLVCKKPSMSSSKVARRKRTVFTLKRTPLRKRGREERRP